MTTAGGSCIRARGFAPITVAPDNLLEQKAKATGATGATQNGLIEFADTENRLHDGEGSDSKGNEGRARDTLSKYVAFVAPVAPAKENCGFARSHIELACGSCGSSVAPEDSNGAANAIEPTVLQQITDAGVPQDWQAGIVAMWQKPSPAGITQSEWQAIRSGSTQLIINWGHQLSALGWSTLDLFAFHRLRPMDRYECAGLVRFLLRADVVAVTAETALLRCRSGARQTYYRRSPSDPDWVAAWELPAVGKDATS